jgi:hypothetical protein
MKVFVSVMLAGEVAALALAAQAGACSTSDPAWSPDGSTIARGQP